jgi:putative addiction module killer protein
VILVGGGLLLDLPPSRVFLQWRYVAYTIQGKIHTRPENELTARLYSCGYIRAMNYLIQQTTIFVTWHASIRDLRAKVAIARRIDRASTGNLGDIKSVGDGVSEMRVDVGAGYRVYFTMRNGVVIVLLAGGDKSSQNTDIRRAKKLAREV